VGGEVYRSIFSRLSGMQLDSTIKVMYNTPVNIQVDRLKTVRKKGGYSAF